MPRKPPPPRGDDRSGTARPGSTWRLFASDAGSTLIEVLVSALMVILIGSATAGALVAGSHFSGDQRFRSQADAVAVQDQERLRGLSDQQLSGLHQTRTVTLPNATSFTVQSDASFLDTTGASSCTSTGAAYYKVASTVSWTENFSTRPAIITDESLLARPVSGDLLTPVSDERLQPLQGVTVTATGPSTQTGATDANGCLVFAGLTPGNYTVNLADPNYVDPNGLASPPNATATVTLTGTAQPTGLPFHLGLAGSVVGTFTTPSIGVAAEADAISWLGTGASFGMTGGYQKSVAPGLASSITTGPLFPFDRTSTLPASYTNNYTVWGGRCWQMEPPTPVDQFTVTPGLTNQAQNVQEPLLDVATVNYYNGATTTAIKPTDVLLTFTSTAGTPCTDSWRPSLTSNATEPASGWLANPGQPFVNTLTTGATASAASTPSSPQGGSLTVCADYAGYKNSTTTTNASFTAPNVVPTILITHGVNAGPC
jgi:type II secretory pathway pseudopilin PulG